MSTNDYIAGLMKRKPGELGLLRTHAGQGLDASVDGFDLFSGLWWPLRQKNAQAPRRDVAWLIAKLYAFCPIEHSPGDTLVHQLQRCQPNGTVERERFRQRFDRMLMQPLSNIEEPLRWALDQVAASGNGLDWVKLTDDLSIWERETTRLRWAEEFLENEGG
ncbi:MAG: type I-E CRISPR-associated protein Cse2/CasB [bacterium]